MRIVVRMPNWVGDCVLALPFLQLLRERHPEARITVLAKRPGAEVFAGSPFADEVWPYAGLWAAASRIRAGRFDVGYLLPNSMSSAVLFALAGVRRRIGYDAEGRGLLLSERLPWRGEVEHRTLRYARLADRGLRPGALTPASHPARIAPGTEAEAEAAALLAGLRGECLLAVNACANAPSRRWPAERFAALARRLAEAAGAEVLLVGGPAAEDRARVAEVAAACRVPGVRDLGGRTTLRGLAAVLARCRLIVTGDTGIMHVAAAAGTPILALEGAADVKVTAPWTAGPFHPVDKHVPCSPCVKNRCINRETPMVCLESIAADEVFARARAFLRSGAFQA